MAEPVMDAPLTPLEMLQLYPPIIVESLADDDAFRARLGLEDGLVLVLGRVGRFGRRIFYDAIRRLHGGAARVEVADVNGGRWTIEGEEFEGRPAIRLVGPDTLEHLAPHHVLHPDASLRLAEFERSLTEAGLWAEALPAWRLLLGERPLDDDEVRRLQISLEATPTKLASRLEATFGKAEGSAALIAPADGAYYSNLVGDAPAISIEELAQRGAREHVERLLTLPDGWGGRMALLLSSHSSIPVGSGLVSLSEAELVDLLEWSASEGDLISRVGAIEVGLAALERAPAIEAALARLAVSVVEQDPHDPAGRLALLSGTLAFVGGEVSRTGVLDGLRPFQRRLAVFAQASYFERLVFGRLDSVPLVTWMRERGLRRFYFATMVERRLEPRWTAEHVSPEQLKAEFTSRISIAASVQEHRIGPGALRDVLFGDEGLRRHVSFPRSFAPGPLEGATVGNGQQPLPPELERLLDDALSVDMLEPKSVIALINLRGVFAIDPGRVDRAIALIRAAGHRFDASVDPETRRLLFNGLAALAAETRNPELAQEVRMMVRKVRLDGGVGISVREEFAMALNAASAHSEWDDWSGYVRDWCVELAFLATGKDAEWLRDDLGLLCEIDPELRRVLGGANAALASVTSPI